MKENKKSMQARYDYLSLQIKKLETEMMELLELANTRNKTIDNYKQQQQEIKKAMELP